MFYSGIFYCVDTGQYTMATGLQRLAYILDRRLITPIQGRCRICWWRFRLWSKAVHCGKNLRTEGTVHVAHGYNVTLGDDVLLGKDVNLGAFKSGKLCVGSNTYIGRYTIILAYEHVHIGNDCLIAPGSHITDVNHGFSRTDVPMRTQEYTSKKVVIEDDVWFGAGVSVLPGVTIGRGSIIGARAVVSKDIPPYSIAVGVPARVIHSRNTNLDISGN